MLLDFNTLVEKYRMKIKGVIQVGCHRCQEHDLYVKIGIDKMVYIEPSSKNFSIIKERFSGEPNENVILVNAACGDAKETKVAYLDTTNQGMSSSLLEPKVHLTQHKEVIFDDAEVWSVVRLDDIPFDRNGYNLLNLDVQGYEDRVLNGAKNTLKYIDYIFTEVNREEMYSDCALIEHLDNVLGEFTRVETGWASPIHGWGDSLYVKSKLL